MKSIIASIAAAAVLAALPASALTPVPYLAVPHDAAVILNTGSTNSLGYRIVVQRGGEAEFVNGATRKTAQITVDLTKQFFADLTAAMPLSDLHAGRCMKSASFGTSVFIYWRHRRSPDLTCPVERQATRLVADAERIAVELQLEKPAVRTLPTNEPRRPMPEPSSS